MPPKGWRIPVEKRFWCRVDKSRGPKSCWLWTGLKRGHMQYGSFGRQGRDGIHESAHRVSWKLHYGEIAAGLHVLHKCDVPACVNPRHLYLGTNFDNMQDRKARGKYATSSFLNSVSGENNRKAKLTTKKIHQIRKLYREGWLHREIAEAFGVVKGTIGFIVRGETWKHVKTQTSRITK